MSVREYIGARYVPLFADPIEWDNTQTYEPLTIVYYQGNSYTSRQAVPTGIAITNETYWALTGNYNAQIEAYRTEVQAFNDRISANESDIETINGSLDGFSDSIDAIESNSWVTTDRIADNAVTTPKIADGSITSQKLNDNVVIELTEMVIFGDSWSDPEVTDAIWGNYLAGKLDLTVHNYAKNAARIANTVTNNLAAQITTATSDTSFNKNKVKYVFIVGGINDYRNSTNKQTVADAAVLAIENCKTLYPNAKILFATNCAFPMTIAQVRYFFDVVRFVRTNCCVQTIDLTGYFGSYHFNPSNYYHLTQAGYKQLAGILASAIEGGDVECPVFSQQITFSSGSNVNWVTQKIENAIHWTLRIDVDISQSTLTSGTISEVGNQLNGGDVHFMGACVPNGTTNTKIVYDVQQTSLSLVMVNPASATTSGKSWVSGIAY